MSTRIVIPDFFRLQLHGPGPNLRIAVGEPSPYVRGLQVDVLQAAQRPAQVQGGGGIDGSARHRTAGSNHSNQQLLKDGLDLKNGREIGCYKTVSPLDRHIKDTPTRLGDIPSANRDVTLSPARPPRYSFQ